jgi:hypothetical protein
MNRNTLITIHMYLSAFFAPMVLLVAISGGLYLIGIKGSVERTELATIERAPLDTSSEQLPAEVSALLAEAGVSDFDFEYVKVKGDTLYTRPTSREHYVIEQGDGAVSIIHAVPDFQSGMVELHKGHGPTLFKTFQKLFALALVFIIVSGVWLGLNARHLRRNTLVTAGLGCLGVLVLLL